MSVRPGLTLIEIVLSLGLMALLFGFSMVPALYVYRQIAVSENRDAVESLGIRIQDISARMFHPAKLELESQGGAYFLIGNVRVPIISMSSCSPSSHTYEYAAPESEADIDCGAHVLKLHPSGKIHIEEDTL